MSDCLRNLLSRTTLVRQISIAFISAVIAVSIIYSITDKSFRLSADGSPNLLEQRPQQNNGNVTSTEARSAVFSQHISKTETAILPNITAERPMRLKSDSPLSGTSKISSNYSTIPIGTGASAAVNKFPTNRQLARQSNGPLFDVNALGTSNLVPNKTIFGAIIMSDYGESNLELTKTWKDDLSGTGGQKVLTAAEMAAMRSRNARDMIAQLPFPVVHWPPIFTKPCPYSKNQHKTERGLAFAHLQIWLDFVYFDADVIATYKRGDVKGKGMYTNTAFSSVSGTYSVAENGTLYKNGKVYSEDDIIAIFEDDADIAVVNINETMVDEFSTMTTDLLFLGWCKGRAARPVPLCAHAYALTRRGARKAIEHFEPCGLALDEQLVIFGKNNWLTYRTAHTWNWEKKFNSQYPKPHDKTYGLFHQKRMGSFNGH